MCLAMVQFVIIAKYVARHFWKPMCSALSKPIRVFALSLSLIPTLIRRGRWGWLWEVSIRDIERRPPWSNRASSRSQLAPEVDPIVSFVCDFTRMGLKECLFSAALGPMDQIGARYPLQVRPRSVTKGSSENARNGCAKRHF